jgi:hypothetical protein
VEAAARKLIPEVADRTVIDNPLKELLALASEANAFRESLRIISNGSTGRSAARAAPRASAPRSRCTGRR